MIADLDNGKYGLLFLFLCGENFIRFIFAGKSFSFCAD
jgi:hypothetical protein